MKCFYQLVFCTELQRIKFRQQGVVLPPIISGVRKHLQACGIGYRGRGQDTTCTPRLHMRDWGQFDSSCVDPRCGLIPSKVTEGHVQGHMCVLVFIHEREGLSASICMQAIIHTNTHTHTRRYFHLHTAGLERVEQHRGPTVRPKPTVHSFLSHRTFAARSTTSG